MSKGEFGDLVRNAHQELAEILPAQEADEGPRRVLEFVNHIALYMEINPHTGMRANGLRRGNTAANIGPLTFSK